MTFKVLILGGTLEGRVLAKQLADDARWEALLSFAGRTQSLQAPGVPHRIGGFGGAAGLAAFLQNGRFAALVDTTHAFAARISANAVTASELTHTPLIRLDRPAWQRANSDRWIDVPDMPAAAAAIGGTAQRVFLSVGRQEIPAFEVAPQHDYLIRAVDTFTPNLPHARVLAARGPFELTAEIALLEREHIQFIVTKNSGTAATYAKIEAARRLGLPVVMVARPQLPAANATPSLEEIVAWLEALHSATQRGE